MSPPTLLFGAFDRHNLGDLLFPHIEAALQPQQELLFAGLAARDLRDYGGHQTQALAQLAVTWGSRPLDIRHVGGELLTCDAWQAAVMLLSPEEAPAVVARLDRHLEARLAWAHAQLGSPALAPYTVPRSLFPAARRVTYSAVGGVALDTAEPALRDEVLANLPMADAVSVRDRTTLSHLQKAGIAARLAPDPAVMVADLFSERIRRQACQGEVARILDCFPQGYIAVQFSADFGDDATLRMIAAQLDQSVAATGFGIVFFRAGAAPWHDDLLLYRRLAAQLRTPSSLVFTGLNIWDLCALIAHSRLYCGSSLHGRIVAMAFALPRFNLRLPPPAERMCKQAAYAATWERPGVPAVVAVDDIALAVRQALDVDPGQYRQTARELVSAFLAARDATINGLP